MAEKIEYSTTGRPHPYHLVRPSVWPLIGAIAGGLLATFALIYMHDIAIFGIKPGLFGVAAG